MGIMKVSEQFILRAERFSDYVKAIIGLGDLDDPEFKMRVLPMEIFSPENSRTINLMRGLAAYKFLELEGQDKELDEAYNCIEAYIIEEASLGLDFALEGRDGEHWAMILAGGAREYGIITEEEYKRIFTEDPSEEK
tara:strand:- start:404 stop:814 length:411 start_codon:yes stop_codon:yes gene_type:complete